MTATTTSRDRIEDFLYHEAELLDEWQLPEWSKLYTDDARYEVTPLNLDDAVDRSSADTLFIIADDKERLSSRARRLMKKSAHAEFPHSKTRHLLSNVRIGENGKDGLAVKANFVVYRTKDDSTTQYMGQAHYLIVPHDGSFRIRRKRCVLDLDTLSAQGRLTIIL